MIALTSYSVAGALTAIIIALCSYLLWRKQHRSMGYPDGPFSLPIFGNLFHVIIAGSITNFITWGRKQYGNVFTVEFGGSKRVVISGYDNIYKLLVTNAEYTSDRSTASMPPEVQETAARSPGIFWAPFPHWKTMRTFALNTLREEGMGKSSLEPKISNEIDLFCSHYLDKHISKPFDFAIPLCKATNNIISEMIFGGRNDYDDPELDRMIKALESNVQAAARAGITKNIPLVKYFKISGLKASNDASQVIFGDMVKRVAEHRENQELDSPRDIFDLYLLHQQKASDSDRAGVFSDENAAVMGLHMYAAGTETTSTALRWAFLYTCTHPDVLHKVQCEIQDKIGLGQPPSYSDRSLLPYTEATLLEVLRLANIVSTSLPHTLSKDMIIDSQMVPAGSDLLFNMASVLHDETVFENPLKFRPERYLSGDVKLKKQRTVPFSLGRRVCLGESLARMELFMFYVTILQRYNVRLADSNKKPSMEPAVDLLLAPQHYELFFTHKQA